MKPKLLITATRCLTEVEYRNLHEQVKSLGFEALLFEDGINGKIDHPPLSFRDRAALAMSNDLAIKATDGKEEWAKKVFDYADALEAERQKRS